LADFQFKPVKKMHFSLNWKTSIFLIFAFFSPLGCTKTINISHVNFAHLYNTDLIAIYPEYDLKHINDTLSLISVSIPSQQLLYEKDKQNDFFISRIKITYQINPQDGSRSGKKRKEVFATDTLLDDHNRRVNIQFTIPFSIGNKNEIYLKFEDLLSRSVHENFILVDKNDNLKRGFFDLRYLNGDELHGLNPSALAGKIIQLFHVAKITTEIQISRFLFSGQVPAAAYVKTGKDELFFENLVADSTFKINLSEGTGHFRALEKGVYHIHEPGNLQNGFSISVYNDPNSSDGDDEEPLGPLRYITSIDEYSDLFSLRDSRLARQRFWQRTTGNPDRGQAQMNRYNERTRQANKLFSSHLPGWKTDRGMIYIVMGPPDLVFRDSGKENWIYHENMSRPGANLTFLRTDNIFSSNHYLLQRSQEYTSFWNISVHAWRR